MEKYAVGVQEREKESRKANMFLAHSASVTLKIHILIFALLHPTQE